MGFCAVGDVDCERRRGFVSVHKSPSSTLTVATPLVILSDRRHHVSVSLIKEEGKGNCGESRATGSWNFAGFFAFMRRCKRMIAGGETSASNSQSATLRSRNIVFGSLLILDIETKLKNARYD